MKNVPKLRFKAFSSDWEKQKVSDLLERVSNPVSVEQDEEYQQIGIRSHGKGIFHKEPVTGLELGNKRVFWVEENAFTVNIVFAWEQAVAVTSSHEKGMIASHRFPMYRANLLKADVQFILRLFLTEKGKNYLELASPGGAGRNKTLGQKNFEELELITPEVEEQTKIADFLTAIDDRISQLAQKCELLEQYKKGVMQKIFSQELRFKDEKGRAFPAWEGKRLGDIGVFQGGGTPTTADDRYWNGVVPWISSSDLNENSIHEISVTRFISDLAIKESATKLIQKNSLLIVSRVGVGKLAVTLDKVCTSQDFTNFTPQSDNVFYLAYYLFFHKGKLLSFSQGTSIKGFTKDDISSLKVELPCLKEQEKIAGFLLAVDEKISQAQAQLDALKQYKQGLLQQMFV